MKTFSLNKIILIIIAFLASASIAWAGLNYYSAGNYFIFDSQLNFGVDPGSYILVGNKLNGQPDSLTVSNNLIFTDLGNAESVGSEMGDGLDRSINKNSIISNGILLKNPDKALLISTVGGSGGVIIDAPETKMGEDYKISKGITIGLPDWTAISPETLYVKKILANYIGAFSGATNPNVVNSGSYLKVDSDTNPTANKIIYDGKPFCETKMWDVSEDINNTITDGGNKLPGQDSPFDRTDSPDGALPASFSTPDSSGVLRYGCDDNTTDLTKPRRTCCDYGYYVFDVDVNAGKMICCRFAQNPLSVQSQ